MCLNLYFVHVPTFLQIPKLEANMDKIARMSSPRVMSTFMQYPYYAPSLEETKNKVIVLLRYHYVQRTVIAKISNLYCRPCSAWHLSSYYLYALKLPQCTR